MNRNYVGQVAFFGRGLGDLRRLAFRGRLSTRRSALWESTSAGSSLHNSRTLDSVYTWLFRSSRGFGWNSLSSLSLQPSTVPCSIVLPFDLLPVRQMTPKIRISDPRNSGCDGKRFIFNRLPFGISNAPIKRDDLENRNWIRWSTNNSEAERTNSLDRYREHQGSDEGQSRRDHA